MDADERQRLTQQRRVTQYAACTFTLQQNRDIDGAEALFDQALTNGLAAIVAHAWPGEEVGARGFVRSASQLLDVVEKKGIRATEDVVRLLNDPDEPEFIDHPFPGLLDDDEERQVPNFTEVWIKVLRDAIGLTQGIRHAREVGEKPDSPLTKEHLDALCLLDAHPVMLGAMMDQARNRAEAEINADDVEEQGRAARYLEAIGEEEAKRRASIDWASEFSPAPGDPDITTVEECPVCGYETLVAPYRDGQLDEVGIGHCFVCSYERTHLVADEIATDIMIARAVARDD